MLGRRRRVLMAAGIGMLTACGESASTGSVAGRSDATPASTPEPRELVLLVASSLTDAFTEMGDDFPRQAGAAGVKLTFNFGASSLLRTQLEQGAPADVFVSADTIQMDQAVKAGLLDGTPQVFVRNRLVVVLPRENRAGVLTLADLAKPGLKVVTTPRDVPVGNYTRQALEKMAADGQFGVGLDQRVLANVVSEEANVRQVVTKVQLGEADAGVVYASDVTPRVAPEVRVIDIPDRFNTVAEYPIGVTKQTKAPATARRFVEYVRGPAGQAILKKHNFIPLA
ncbi:MAG: Molybdenum ABC transporter, substrate-binding protein ModA [uncultured Chloroflexi bacterium]|uniref:Molybdenum ABC transporter, substrate-binding protein ModA n=1 Tax=uncultured Chloroflexota bacterium TaxID=166587 RepID=A0A6J4IBY5_9CHLR|nr:MAG: Molybdenum ABC transporter, substrate-binding protein ModA [uncultured Chloroflexota bacterium]